MGQQGFTRGVIFFQTVKIELRHKTNSLDKTRVKRAFAVLVAQTIVPNLGQQSLLSIKLAQVLNCCFFNVCFRLIARLHLP